MIKLTLKENPLGASPKALAVPHQSLAKVNCYTDGQSNNLRVANARKMEVKPEQIIVSKDKDVLILETCMVFMDENSEFIVARSSFPIYDIYSVCMRAWLVNPRMKDYNLDLEAMPNVSPLLTKLIFVCNPNNSAGSVVSSNEVNRFLESIPDQVHEIFDETYVEYVYNAQVPDSLSFIRARRENIW